MDNPALPAARDPLQRSKRFLRLASTCIGFLLVAAAGLYTWIFVYHPCEVDVVKDASTILTTQLRTFDGVSQVAATASRSAPDHPVNTLKLMFMDTQEVVVPACMQMAKHELINYMGTVISAFDAYRADEDDATVRDWLRQSNVHYNNFSSELEEVNKCAPYCLRK